MQRHNNNLLCADLEKLFTKLAPARSRKPMLWFGISGSWRKTDSKIEKEVREAVRKVILRGDGIVSGGALNVDYFATDEAIKLNPEADKIKVFLPAPLEIYAAHYRKRAEEGVITSAQAETLIAQLEHIQNTDPDSLICDTRNIEVNHETYFQRNSQVVNFSDAIVAFQVDDSEGVSDTCDKALAQGKPVCLKRYKID